MLAINLSSSTIVSDTFGFLKFPYPEFQEQSANSPSSSQASTINVANNPLRLWDERVKSLTLLSASRDIKQVYMLLMHAINEAEFSNALFADPSLFIVDYPDMLGNQRP